MRGGSRLKREQLKREMEKRNLTVLGMQETKVVERKIEELDEYLIYFAGQEGAGGHHGICLVIQKEVKHQVKIVSERLMTVNLIDQKVT